MLNLIRATCLFIAATGLATAAERKDPTEINPVDFTTETQQMSSEAAVLDMAWWIPAEFWEAVLRQDPSVPREQADAMLEVMRPYFVIVVVQADISPFGSFTFIPEPRIERGLDVTYIDERGNRSSLDVLETTNPDFELLLLQLGPILANAMGNLGENFNFYAFSATDKDGNRIASPFEPGRLSVSLGAREGAAPTEFEFEAPLDALFRPRMCPNGKPAHISWNFCPWDGSRLRD